MNNEDILKKEQEEISRIKKINEENSLKRNTIKTGYYLKYLLPYILTTGISFGLFSIIGKAPFIKDSYDATLETKKEIDSYGIMKKEEQYKKNPTIRATITYLTDWEERQNGIFVRERNTYIASEFKEEVIEKIVKNNDITSLEELLGQPISTETQTQYTTNKNNLPHSPYMTAIIYNEDQNSYITITESNKSNVIYTTIWLITTLYANALVYDDIKKATKGKSKEEFKKEMKKIDERYPKVDTSKMTKKLKLDKKRNEIIKKWDEK